MSNEELLAQDNLLWTDEGRKRILVLMERAVVAERDRILQLLPGGQFCDPQHIADAIRGEN